MIGKSFSFATPIEDDDFTDIEMISDLGKNVK
jgi:hypothetical protein